MAKTEVIASLRLPGFHSWPEAPDEVSFLRQPHRHEFHVTMWKVVPHNDRETEIILMKAEAERKLRGRYPNHSGLGMSMGRDSCETVAAWLLASMGLSRCRVLEDGENGAEVTA